MTFLNPAILWGLTAISIPILIHLFNLRRTKKIEFSTLMFLKEIQQTKYKKIKLKQLLILLCRILLIIFLVLAFAQPFQKGYKSQGEEVRSTVLLVLDDSYSMEVKSDSGSTFDEAKKKLLQTLSVLNDKDEMYFTTTSKIGKPGEKIFFDNKDALADSISHTKISDVTRDLDYIMYYSNQILSASPNTFKELFFFTDGQKSTFLNQSNTFSELKNDDNTKYNIVVCGKRTGNNISIDTINVISKIFQKGKAIKLKCTVTNHNNFNAVNTTFTLHIDGDKREREEKVIDISSNSSVDLDFSFIPESTGFGGGSVNLTPAGSTGITNDDEILHDNKRYFSYKIPDKIKLLAVTSSQNDMQYIKLALASSEELSNLPAGGIQAGDSTGSKVSYFDIKQAGENDLSGEFNNTNRFDCILIVNKKSFSSDESAKLFDYVQNGGGLIIYPGDNTDYNNYNSTLFKKFDLQGINGTFGVKNGGDIFKFDKVDLEHPVFEGIFKKKEGDETGFYRESPNIKFGYNLVGGINSIPLIKLNNERNFLIEYTSGKGRILFYSILPDMSYSDFPAKNIFPPITVRSILYLSNLNTSKEAVTGNDYFIDPSGLNISTKDTTHISTVDMLSKSIIPVNNNNLINVKNYLDFTSNYKITSSNRTLFEFPCNFDKRESILDKLNESELRDLFEKEYKLKPNIIPADKSFIQTLQQIRTGKELWNYALILALLFLLTEFAISRWFFTKPAEVMEENK